MKHTPRTAAGLASLAAAVLLSSCGTSATGDTGPDTEQASPAASSSPSPTTEETETDSAPAAPTRHSLVVRGQRIRATLAAPDRFRTDGSIPGRLHFLPLNVVTDADAERWGDFFLYSPTEVHDPVSQELVPVPDDLAGWLEANKGVRVVSTRTHRFGSATAREVNVERDGSLLFPGDEPGGPGGLERYVVWEVDGLWLVGQASTFRGIEGITAPAGRDDVFMALLRSVRVEPKG